MRFAILGDHPDGWRTARALVESGRHQILVYQGPKPDEQQLGYWPALRVTADLEEVLADPSIEAAIVAGKPGERLDQLRRVLQSERPAFCVHPVDDKPDGAYEINLLQGDMHQVVIPILPEAVHPLVQRLVGSLRQSDHALVPRRLVEYECWDAGEVVLDLGKSPHRPHYPGWTLLRQVGGEIVEVAAFAPGEEIEPGQVAVAQGRFADGCLFRCLYVPRHTESKTLLRVWTGHTSAELVLGRHPRLCLPEDGAAVDGYQPADAWSQLVEQFDAALARLRDQPRASPGAGPAPPEMGALSWWDEIRALELDDAARRSIERRRASTLEFQEVGEDVGFKGTMTLVGCGLLWLIPLLLIVAAGFPQVGWLIVPVLLAFLGLQLLRWLVPPPPQSPGPPTPPAAF